MGNLYHKKKQRWKPEVLILNSELRVPHFLRPKVPFSRLVDWREGSPTKTKIYGSMAFQFRWFEGHRWICGSKAGGVGDSCQVQLWRVWGLLSKPTAQSFAISVHGQRISINQTAVGTEQFQAYVWDEFEAILRSHVFSWWGEKIQYWVR